MRKNRAGSLSGRATGCDPARLRFESSPALLKEYREHLKEQREQILKAFRVPKKYLRLPDKIKRRHHEMAIF